MNNSLYIRKQIIPQIKNNPEAIKNLTFGGGRKQVITKKLITITNALNFDITEGFFNRIFTAIKLTTRYIINN